MACNGKTIPFLGVDINQSATRFHQLKMRCPSTNMQGMTMKLFYLKFIKIQPLLIHPSSRN